MVSALERTGRKGCRENGNSLRIGTGEEEHTPRQIGGVMRVNPSHRIGDAKQLWILPHTEQVGHLLTAARGTNSRQCEKQARKTMPETRAKQDTRHASEPTARPSRAARGLACHLAGMAQSGYC